MTVYYQTPESVRASRRVAGASGTAISRLVQLAGKHFRDADAVREWQARDKHAEFERQLSELRKTFDDLATERERAFAGDVVRLTNERDAAIARAERAEAERDAALAVLVEWQEAEEELRHIPQDATPLAPYVQRYTRAEAMRREVLRRYSALPGWFCAHCRVFNGSAKEERSTCRACDRPRAEGPPPVLGDVIPAVRSALLEAADGAPDPHQPVGPPRQSPPPKRVPPSPDDVPATTGSVGTLPSGDEPYGLKDNERLRQAGSLTRKG